MAYRPISINPDQAVAQIQQAKQLGVQDVARGIQNIGQTMQFAKGIGDQYQDFQNRKEILEQASQLGGGQVAPQAPINPLERPPEEQEAIISEGGLIDDQTRAEFVQDTEGLIEAEPQEMVSKLVERDQKLKSQGRDSTDTQQLIQLAATNPQQAKLAIGNIQQMITNKSVRDYMARSPESAKKFLQGIGATGMDAGALSGKARGFIGTPNIVNIDEKPHYSGLYEESDGSVVVKTMPFEEGAELISRTGQTAEEESYLDIKTAQGKAEAKERAETRAAQEKAKQKSLGSGEGSRITASIDEAYSSVGAMPTVNRALELMDSVETGGFDKARIKAKQTFGIESADEGELSNLLGKNVLSQLRTTFGAAFTAKEGESLKEIESNLSNNPATNKRLLKNAKKIIEISVNRGIRAAKRAGQNEDVAELERLMSEKLVEDSDKSPANVGRFKITVE